MHHFCSVGGRLVQDCYDSVCHIRTIVITTRLWIKQDFRPNLDFINLRDDGSQIIRVVLPEASC